MTELWSTPTLGGQMKEREPAKETEKKCLVRGEKSSRLGQMLLIDEVI